MQTDLEGFLEWFRRQGIKVLQTPSTYWAEAGPRIFQAIPYHWVIEPSELEIDEFLRKWGVIGLRYSTPVNNTIGQISYHGVCTTKNYDMNYLSSNARSVIRRGLKNCTVEQIPLKRLAYEGWELQADTLERQDRRGGLRKDEWERLCLEAEGIKVFEAWAAIVNNKLAATILTAQIDDTCYFLYPQSHRDYLHLHVNNALAYTLTYQLLSRSSVKSVFYGLHSLDAPPSVDEFKFRMGYTALPVRQRVVFHPALRPLFNPASHALLKRFMRLRPGNPALAKAEGMLRFYLQGLRPLDQQEWPAILCPSPDKTVM